MQVCLQAPLPRQETYEEIHNGCQDGIEEEIAVVQEQLKRWNADKPLPVRGGSEEGMEGDHWLYRLEIDTEVQVPEYTAVELVIRNRTYRGIVESLEEKGKVLNVVMEDRLMGEVREAIIWFDATFPLRKLQEALACLSPASGHKGLPLIRKALGLDPALVGLAEVDAQVLRMSGLNEGQIQLIRQALGSELTLGFGPPGTGKTRAAGSLATAAVAVEDKRILVTAHTNQALDTLMARILETAPREWIQEGSVLRLGKLSRDFQHLDVTIEDVARKLARQLKMEIGGALADLETRAMPYLAFAPLSVSSLKGKKKKKKGLAEEYAERLSTIEARLSDMIPNADVRDEFLAVLAETKRLKEVLEEFTGGILRRARIVGATLSKIAIDFEDMGSFDTVLIDEASMCQLPQAIVALGCARKQVVFLGDPVQLPPVVQSRGKKAKEFLKRNPYAQMGLEDPSLEDPRRPMLLVQHRMAPSIREVVSEHFYAGKLLDAPEVLQYELPNGGNLILIDTSDAGMQAERNERSRSNPGHANLIAELVQTLVQQDSPEVGIITPFAPQRRVLSNMLWKRVPGFTRMGGFVSTIHSAQGGEKSTIIVDTVDTPPSFGTFLDERRTPELPQLLNVALSRAKRRLIVVANATGFRKAYGRDSLIVRLMLHMAHNGRHIRAKDRTAEDIARDILSSQRPAPLSVA